MGMNEPGKNAPDEVTLEALVEKWKSERLAEISHKQRAFAAETAILEILLGMGDLEEASKIMKISENLIL